MAFSLQSDGVKKVIRSFLASSKEGLTTNEIRHNFKEFYKKPLGTEREIEEWLSRQTDLCVLYGTSPQGKVWAAVENDDILHVQKLIGKQKPKKKKKDIRPITRAYSARSGSGFGNRVVRIDSRFSRDGNLSDYNCNVTGATRLPKKSVSSYGYVEKSYMKRSASGWSHDENSQDSQADEGTINDGHNSREPLRITTIQDRPTTPALSTAQSYAESEDSSRMSEIAADVNRTRTGRNNQWEEPAINQSKVSMTTQHDASEVGSQRRSPKTKQASRNALKKFLVEQIQKHDNHIHIDALHLVSNRDFMMKLLKKQSISIEKFRQILGIWKTEIIIREDGFVETIQDINEKASQTAVASCDDSPSGETLQAVVKRLDKLDMNMKTILENQNQLENAIKLLMTEIMRKWKFVE